MKVGLVEYACVVCTTVGIFCIGVLHLWSHFFETRGGFSFVPIYALPGGTWDHPEENYAVLPGVAEYYSVVTAAPVSAVLLLYIGWKLSYPRPAMCLFGLDLWMYVLAFFSHLCMHPIINTVTVFSVMSNALYTFNLYAGLSFGSLQSQKARSVVSLTLLICVYFAVTRVPIWLGARGGVPALFVIQTPAVVAATIGAYRSKSKHRNLGETFDILINSGIILCLAMFTSLLEVMYGELWYGKFFAGFPLLHVMVHVFEQVAIYLYGIGVASLAIADKFGPRAVEIRLFDPPSLQQKIHLTETPALTVHHPISALPVGSLIANQVEFEHDQAVLRRERLQLHTYAFVAKQSVILSSVISLQASAVLVLERVITKLDAEKRLLSMYASEAERITALYRKQISQAERRILDIDAVYIPEHGSIAPAQPLVIGEAAVTPNSVDTVKPATSTVDECTNCGRVFASLRVFAEWFSIHEFQSKSRPSSAKSQASSAVRTDPLELAQRQSCFYLVSDHDRMQYTLYVTMGRLFLGAGPTTQLGKDSLGFKFLPLNCLYYSGVANGGELIVRPSCVKGHAPEWVSRRPSEFPEVIGESAVTAGTLFLKMPHSVWRSWLADSVCYSTSTNLAKAAAVSLHAQTGKPFSEMFASAESLHTFEHTASCTSFADRLRCIQTAIPKL